MAVAKGWMRPCTPEIAFAKQEMELSIELVVLLIVVFLTSQVSVYLNSYMNLSYLRTFIDACDKYATAKARLAEANKPVYKPPNQPPNQPAQQPAQPAAPPAPRDERNQ